MVFKSFQILVFLMVLSVPIFSFAQQMYTKESDFSIFSQNPKQYLEKTFADDPETLTKDNFYYNAKALRKNVNENFDEQLKKRHSSYVEHNDYELPEIIFKRKYNEKNIHLPPSISKNDLNRFAFNAVKKDEYNGLLALLDKGVEIDTRNSAGNTLLMSAIAAKRNNIAELLIMRGADTHAVNSRGQGVFHIAALVNNKSALQSLIKRNNFINIFDKQGNAPIFLAASRNYWDVVMFLVANGANIDAQNNEGMSLLHMSAASGNYGATKMLLDYGINPFLKTTRGYSAMEFALSSGNRNLVQLIRQAQCCDRRWNTSMNY